MPPDPPAVPLDPALLAAFRQQGAPIVARERGLTAACRIKLAGVARALGIGDDQIEEAIRSLTMAEPSAPPNAQVERFRRRLRKDLAGKSRTIIGPTIEAEILAAALRKYGLDDAAAGAALREVAEELDLTVISASDAIQNLAAQIDQAAGDSTWLAREAWDRLRSAGCKWGLELEVIDQLIEERLAANRADYLRRSFWTRATLYGAGGAVIAAGVIIGVLMIARSTTNDATGALATATSSTSSRGTRSAPPPAWWDVDLTVEMAHARGRGGNLASACEAIVSSDPAERAAGYERLMELVRGSSDRAELLTAASKITAGCLALEPDETSVDRLQTAVFSLLPGTDASLPASAAQWNLGYWAADATAAALDRRGSKKERTEALANALGSALGADVDPAMPRAQRQRLLRERVASAQYRQLAHAAAKQPAEVAALYPSLVPRAAALLSDEERLQADTTLLVAVLPVAGSDWKTYERPLVRCIAAPDPLYALRLTDALRKTTDDKLIEHLSELLIVRSGARPKSADKKDVVLAVRQALGGGAAMTAADRWLTLDDEVKPLLATPAATDDRELLRQTVALAHFTTLAVALAQGEAGFASFDAGIAQPPQLVAKRSATADILSLTSSGASRPKRPLAKSQQRDLTKSIESLGSRTPSGQVEREAALRSLASLAGETADVTPQQAAHLANYFLSEKKGDEQTTATAALADLKPWRHLRLAIADAMPSSKLAAEYQREMVSTLIGRDLPGGIRPTELRRLLLASVLEELNAEADVESSSGGDLLEAAAESLSASYRQRAALVRMAPTTSVSAETPAQALEAMLSSLAAASGAPKKQGSLAERLPHELKAAQYLGGDDLHCTIALQRLLIDASSRRVAAARPQHAAAARQIAADSLAASAGAANALVQLRQQEAALLKLWMLYAPGA